MSSVGHRLTSCAFSVDDFLAANDIFKTVAFANHMGFGAIDQNLGRARPAVVVRRHHEAVCASAHHRQQIARVGLRQVALAREKISALAYRADTSAVDDRSPPARRITGTIA